MVVTSIHNFENKALIRFLSIIANSIIAYCDVFLKGTTTNNSKDLATLDQILHTKFFTLLTNNIEPFNIEITPHAEPSNFGSLYEELLATTTQKKLGIFYSPLEQVEKLVNDAICLLPRSTTNPTVLDPACGGGIFLITALNKLASDDFSSRATILTNQIYGVDKDPIAVELTKIALLCELVRGSNVSTTNTTSLPCLNNTICAGDTLLSDIQDSDESFSIKQRFSSVLNQGGFDLIIGNPPYGLSRDEQLSNKENSILKSAYSEYRCGKINKYILFMCKGFSLLNNRGVLSYIVPNAWLGIKGGNKVRKLFIDSKSLDKITVFNFPVFSDPSVEVVTFIVDRNKQHSNIEVTQVSKNFESSTNFELRYEAITNSPNFIIPIHWDRASSDIIRVIKCNSKPLRAYSEYFEPLIALQAYAEGKGTPPQSKDTVREHSFDYNYKFDQDTYPYLIGKDIKRYAINWSGNFLRYGQWLAEPQSLTRFTGPRLVLREILGRPPYRIKAAFVEDLLLYNKSVLHILPKQGVGKKQLLALLAILNSKLASTIISLLGRKSQRNIFPKLVNDDLLDFPIPNTFIDNVELLASIAIDSGREEDKLETIVMQMYGLTQCNTKGQDNQITNHML